MFREFFDRFRFVKRIWDHFEYHEKITERMVNDLKEEIMVLKKIVPLYDHRCLYVPDTFSFLHGSHSPSREERMDVVRKKLREEGFHFVFKKKNEEEIWIKPGQIDIKANAQIS